MESGGNLGNPVAWTPLETRPGADSRADLETEGLIIVKNIILVTCYLLLVLVFQSPN